VPERKIQGGEAARETMPEAEEDEDGQPVPEPEFVERRISIVARVLVQRTMPESCQAQLLRALERQVTRRDPLIGWPDLYAVQGPLDLSGLHDLLGPRDA
jgi:hypothetical protein